jgi:hypothetical protein
MRNPYAIMNDGNYPISAGDYIRADVTYFGAGVFRLRIFDDTKKWSYLKAWTSRHAGAPPRTGEWIVEYPARGNGTVFPQVDHSIMFTDCYWQQDTELKQLALGHGLSRATIFSYLNGKGAFPKEITSDVLTAGTDFTVTWLTF